MQLLCISCSFNWKSAFITLIHTEITGADSAVNLQAQILLYCIVAFKSSMEMTVTSACFTYCWSCTFIKQTLLQWLKYHINIAFSSSFFVYDCFVLVIDAPDISEQFKAGEEEHAPSSSWWAISYSLPCSPYDQPEDLVRFLHYIRSISSIIMKIIAYAMYA